MKPTTQSKTVRAAIYTRVSTEEGLGQEFNSLDAQRDACLAFIQSQKNQGWKAITPTFDDGGFSGANLNRPALARLTEEIEEGKVDVVVTYKVDRLSRSLLDFVRMMEMFDQRKIAYVSVTQQINSSTPMGQLMYHILLSFAQFERLQIAERTRDKMRAAKRRGKWIGGRPPLGYDIDPKERKLVINPEEAATVRQIFQIYVQERSITSTLRVLEERGIHSKRWLTKSQKPCGGKPFSKTSLSRLLTNTIYLGKVSLDDEVFDGEHEAIVEAKLFEQVQAILTDNLRCKKSNKESKYNPLLKGLLFCSSCNRSMIHASTKKSPTRHYRYYVCGRAMKEGWANCKAPSVPAMQIESFVLNQIRSLSTDTSVITRTHEEVVRLTREHQSDAIERKQSLLESIRQCREAIQNASTTETKKFYRSQIDDYQAAIEKLESELRTIEGFAPSRPVIAATLSNFTNVWEATPALQRIELLNQVVERIDYAGPEDSLEIILKPTGIQSLTTDEQLRSDTTHH